MKKIIHRLTEAFLLGISLLCLTGCTIEVPQYWQDRCYPLNFHTKTQHYNDTVEEAAAYTAIFKYAPFYELENNCICDGFNKATVCYKAVQDPVAEAEKYIQMLIACGFTQPDEDRPKHFEKTICDDYEGKPVILYVNLGVYELEYKEMYNFQILYQFSNKYYDEYLLGRRPAKTEAKK